ncbi:MAG: accessory gene regulator B family protein [Lachnospira sp.]|nr:accessory gene regulator B family protein [Lachnospira sp.]
MFDYIQKSFGYSNYEIAQLRHAFKVYISEISKMLIIGLFFITRLPLFIWTLLIFQLMRQATGGMHFKTYISCLIASLSFFILSIDILPLIPVCRLIQLISLLICVIISHCLGPVISDIHMPLSKDAIAKAKLRLITIVFFYMLFLFIMPQNAYTNSGFWVIILNTLQLIVARIRKEVKHTNENQNTFSRTDV